jgi:hypothetical protein
MLLVQLRIAPESTEFKTQTSVSLYRGEATGSSEDGFQISAMYKHGDQNAEKKHDSDNGPPNGKLMM